MRKVKGIPEGLNTVTPYIIVDGADRLIDFIKKGFNGEIVSIQRSDENRVLHATVRIGNSPIMISDTMPDMEPVTAMLYIYTGDVDSLFRQASKTKAKVVQEPKDEFYGDRAGALEDEWGNSWWIATQVEEVSEEELRRRVRARNEEMAH